MHFPTRPTSPLGWALSQSIQHRSRQRGQCRRVGASTRPGTALAPRRSRVVPVVPRSSGEHPPGADSEYKRREANGQRSTPHSRIGGEVARRAGLRGAFEAGEAAVRGLCWLQLRVVRAFKSTLEDMEERLSAHSAAGLRSRLRAPPADIAYIDADADDAAGGPRAETTIF